MRQASRLDVFLGSELVGTIHDSSPVAFEYAATWLERADPIPVAAIPLRAGRNDTAAVQAYVENLLPEGELRLYIAEQKKVSTLFAMLLEVAGDTAGGFVILPAGRAPGLATYKTTSWKALGDILVKKSTAAVDIKGRDARISLAGAQDKASIAIFGDGVPRLPNGTAPSTHILKPNIKRLAKVWHSAANETIIMMTAAKCGLPTAEVFYEPHTQSCVVRRFDRLTHADGAVGRLIQYDLCQLAGLVSEKKYEKEGGPGIATCAELIRTYSSQPALDLRNFVAWIFFNLYVGNNDSHAKNLSVYRVPGVGVTLAPFYDLMCTRLYPGLSPEFAFAIGGETKPGSVTRANITVMAGQLRMQPRFIANEAGELARKIPDAIGQSVEEVMPSLPHGAKDLAKKLQRYVRSTTTKIASRIGDR
jgi:serine/threonine-protein kinase HipA